MKNSNPNDGGTPGRRTPPPDSLSEFRFKKSISIDGVGKSVLLASVAVRNRFQKQIIAICSEYQVRWSGKIEEVKQRSGSPVPEAAVNGLTPLTPAQQGFAPPDSSHIVEIGGDSQTAVDSAAEAILRIIRERSLHRDLFPLSDVERSVLLSSENGVPRVALLCEQAQVYNGSIQRAPAGLNAGSKDYALQVAAPTDNDLQRGLAALRKALSDATKFTQPLRFSEHARNYLLSAGAPDPASSRPAPIRLVQFLQRQNGPIYATKLQDEVSDPANSSSTAPPAATVAPSNGVSLQPISTAFPGATVVTLSLLSNEAERVQKAGQELMKEVDAYFSANQVPSKGVGTRILVPESLFDPALLATLPSGPFDKQSPQQRQLAEQLQCTLYNYEAVGVPGGELTAAKLDLLEDHHKVASLLCEEWVSLPPQASTTGTATTVPLRVLQMNCEVVDKPDEPRSTRQGYAEWFKKELSRHHPATPQGAAGNDLPDVISLQEAWAEAILDAVGDRYTALFFHRPDWHVAHSTAGEHEFQKDPGIYSSMLLVKKGKPSNPASWIISRSGIFDLFAYDRVADPGTVIPNNQKLIVVELQSASSPTAKVIIGSVHMKSTSSAYPDDVPAPKKQPWQQIPGDSTTVIDPPPAWEYRRQHGLQIASILSGFRNSLQLPARGTSAGSAEAPVILLGDLNASPCIMADKRQSGREIALVFMQYLGLKSAMATLREHQLLEFEKLALAAGPALPANWRVPVSETLNGGDIDYIFFGGRGSQLSLVGGHLMWNKSQTDSNRLRFGSDHAPLFMEFELTID